MAGLPIQIVNDKPVLKLVPWQSDFIQSPLRFKTAVCGRRSGKTACNHASLFIDGTTLPADSEVWVVAKTYRQAYDTYFKPLFEATKSIFPNWFIKDSSRSYLTAKTITGVEFRFAGSDNADSLLGAGIAKLYLDEFQSQKEETWYKLRPMLSDNGGGAVITGTPRGFNHLHEKWWDGWQDNPNAIPNWGSWLITTAEAGTVSAEEIEQAKMDMSPQEFEQEYNASFFNLQGLVYCEFDMQLNHTDDEIKDGDVLFVGMDFNVDPMTASVAKKAYNENTGVQELRFCDEFFLRNSTTSKLCAAMKAKYPKHRILVYPDASGRARSTTGNTNFQIIEQFGFEIMDNVSNPEIEHRVNAVNAQLCNVKGIRRLKVNTKKCPNIVKTFMGHTYDDNGKPDKKSGLDHMGDGIGYLVWYEYSSQGNRSYVSA